MHLSIIKRSAILLFAFIFLLGGESHAAADGERPNVLFIIVDDLNDYIGELSGHPQAITPHIDKLARSAVSFTNAHSNNPVCAPSRSSLFSGIYPHQSKKFFWDKWYNHPVLKNSKPFIEYFDDNGYHVAGSGKLQHHDLKRLWDEWGVDVNNYGPFAFNGKERVGHPYVPEPFRSIGPVDGSFAPLSEVPSYPDSISGGNRAGYVHSWNNKPFHYRNEQDRDLLPDERHAEWAVKKIEALENQESGEPFFLGLGFVRPHTPMYAPKKYFEMFPVEEIELPVRLSGDSRDTFYSLVYPPSLKGPRYFRTLEASYPDIETGLKHFIQAYLACVAFVDDQIGKVLDALDNSSLRENTVVVLTSDHGWHMGEKEYLFKGSPWEESTRVPLIIRAPGISQPGATVSHPVSLIDIYPTLKDLAGLEGPTMKNDRGMPLDGYSLRPFLTDPDTRTWEGPDGALTVVYGRQTKEDIFQQTYSYRTRNWRYIRYRNGEEELYYHEADPYEWNNLANDKRFYEQKEKLKSELFDMLHGKRD